MTDKTACTIHILGRALDLHCDADEVEQLQRASILLDGQMRELREQHNIVSSERLAIFAGLLLAQTVLTLQDEERENNNALQQSLKKLNHKINQSLNAHEQIDIIHTEEDQ